MPGMEIAFMFSSLLLLSFGYGNANHIIRSPRITNWGSWTGYEYCPKGQFVNGMQLKVEPIRKPGLFGYRDNTALNAVKLFCGKVGTQPKNGSSVDIGPVDHGYGDWGTRLYCPENTFVTGFQLKSAPPKGANFFSWFLGLNANDDTAANNLRIFCSHKTHYVEGYGTHEGYWTSSQHCLERQAVCGFQIQYEYYKGKGDDTGLNNIDMACCNVQSPLQNCTPQETWDVVKECDNSHGVTDLSCNYQKRTGIGYAKSAPKSATVTYHNLGFDLGTVGNMLMKHPYSAQSFLPSNFEVTLEETVHSLTFTVLPGYKTEIMQVVGTCGIYSIRTPKFIRSDTNVKNQSDTIFNELGNNGAQLSVLNYEASK